MQVYFNVTRGWLKRKLEECDEKNIPENSSLQVQVDTSMLPNGVYNPQGEISQREVGDTVRAKMLCNEVASYAGGGAKIKLGAVYSSDINSENRAFSDATPSGSCEMMIQGGRPAIKLFEAGREYYLDFTKVQR